MELGKGNGAFCGQWIDGDGAIVIIQAPPTRLCWPDGTVSDITIRDGSALQLMDGSSACEGKLSSDGEWLLWNDGDTWVRLPSNVEVGRELACQNNRAVEDNSDGGGYHDADADLQLCLKTWDKSIQNKTPVATPGKVGAEKILATRQQQDPHENVSTGDSGEEEAGRGPEAQAPFPNDPKELPVKELEMSEPPACTEDTTCDEDLKCAPQLLHQRASAEDQEHFRAEEERTQSLEEWEQEVAKEEPTPPKSFEARAGKQWAPAASDEWGELAPEASAEHAQGGAGPSQQKHEELPEIERPEVPRRPEHRLAEDPLTNSHRLERITSCPGQDTLENPVPSILQQVYTDPLEYRVAHANVFLREDASSTADCLTLLQRGDVIHGYQQSHWLFVDMVHKGWVLIDGTSMGFGTLLEHKYLGLRVQQTFSGAALLEWDKLPGARFVDYAIQWSFVSHPRTTTTAASHIPRTCAKITGLPPQVKLNLRVVACIYTETKSKGGERVAAIVGNWTQAETVDDPAVEALEQPMPEKMPDIYSNPLKYRVRPSQVTILSWPSTKAAACSQLPRGTEVAGYQQGNWLCVTMPCSGWLPINSSDPCRHQLLCHSYLECRVLRAYSEAILVEWDEVPGAKFVDYTLEWTHFASEAVSIGNEHLPRAPALLRGLPAEERVLVRVCARVYTQAKGSSGALFSTVVGAWAEAETEPAVTPMEEETLCLDPMGNLHGRCMDCACRSFAGMQLEPELTRKSKAEERVVCRRCGCSCVRHVIVGELQYHKKGSSTVPSAFKLPPHLLHEAEQEARPAEQAEKASKAGMPSGVKPLERDKLEATIWCPEDSGLDGDPMSFILDKIAQARTLYETLGVMPHCDDKDIRHAHRRIALYIHPDKVLHRDDKDLVSQAEAAFKIVSAAYEVLSDNLKRGSYDQSIRSSGHGPYCGSNSSTRKDLTVASLLRRFLSKAMWGWDLDAKPPGDWEEYGRGVYGRSQQANITLLHAITKEEMTIQVDHGTSLASLKSCITSRVKRGPATAIEIATSNGEVLQNDFLIPHSMSLVLAGISSLGPARYIKLCLSHAHTGARYYMMVPDTATITEVRAAAARSLKVETREVRLGYRYNNKEKFRELDEADLLNGRTHILVLGIEIPINLSVEEAVELQSELLQAYSEVSFQRELDELLAQHPPLDGLVDADFKERWNYLLRHAHKNILLKHGFDGPHGAMTMLAAFNKVNSHPAVQQMSAQIDGKLRITRGTALPPVIAVLVQPADEDCDSDDEVQRGFKVVLPVGSNIGQLKEGVAKKLNEGISKIEVVTLGKPVLFSKTRDITIHSNDFEAVGMRRLFQIRGIKMPPQAVLDKTLQEQRQQVQRAAAEQALTRRAKEKAAAWEAIKDCKGCSAQLQVFRGHVSKADRKWYCNQCWSKHYRRDGRQNAAHAVMVTDSIAAEENGIDRETHRCTTPGCRYRMHRNTHLGAFIFCCLQCKEGCGHGPSCERRSPGREDSPEPLLDEVASEPAKQERVELAELRTCTTSRPVPKPPASLKPQSSMPQAQQPELIQPKEESNPLRAASEQPPAVTIEVKNLSHSDLVVSLSLKATEKWLEVKRALAWRVGRPDILQNGKLACKTEDGGYSSLADEKAVQESQEVFLFNSDMSYNPNSCDLKDEDYKKAERKRQQPGMPLVKRAAPTEPKEVLLTIKDFQTGRGFDMKVLKTMTIHEVKQAIAWATKRPEQEILGAKLLKKSGGEYLALVNSEVMGNHRMFWTTNVDITPKQGSPVEKLYLRKGQPVVCPAVEQDRAATGVNEDQDGWRKQSEEAKDPEWVLVGIAHAMKKDEPTVDIVIMDNSLLSNVLEALSKRLDSVEVLRQGKFVERKGAAAYKGLKLTDPLKKRRELLFMGADLKRR